MLDLILPIGTIVKLKDAEKSIMIYGIMQTVKTMDGTITKYDYIGVPYPVGYVSSEFTLGFNHDQIESVLFKGYDDEEFKNLVSAIKMANFINENRDKIIEAMEKKAKDVDVNG